jgi:hypothetical protein
MKNYFYTMNWVIRMRNVVLFVIFLSLGLVLSIGGVEELFGPAQKPSDIHLRYVTGKLSRAPEINSYRRRAAYLHIVEHPQLVFGMTGAGYDAAKIPVMRDEIRVGDTVIIGIGEDDTAKVQAAADGPVYIPVYTLRTRTLVISTLEGYCKATNSDRWIGAVIIFLGGLFILSAFGLLKKRKR